MILLDLSHTCHTRARTGIQRVARSLHAELARQGCVQPVTWDPYANQWRRLESWEAANLESDAPGGKRGARWPWSAKVRGHYHRWVGRHPTMPAAEGLIVPELFSHSVGAALARLPNGFPRIAVFHDAIALKLPELTPTATVSRFPAYLQELLQFDGIAAVSEDSRQCLLDYWSWLGCPDHPPVQTIPLGLDLPRSSRVVGSTEMLPTIICVGSLEGRKNHVALLNAAEHLWQQGKSFHLRLIGHAQAETGAGAIARINELKQAGRPLTYDGAVDETTLEHAYDSCSFTVYPSLMEGFGLPVLESLARGKPCICSSLGALGESARPGGAVALPLVDVTSLSLAIDDLLAHPTKVAELAAAARQRTYRTWADYTNDLLRWLKTLG